jgi:hypothetical protein
MNFTEIRCYDVNDFKVYYVERYVCSYKPGELLADAKISELNTVCLPVPVTFVGLLIHFSV